MRTAMTLLGAILISGLTASAGRIVVNHDEWPLSNSGFALASAGSAGTFALNVAQFLKASPGPGNFLVYSTNFGFGSQFVSTLTGSGHTVTASTAVPFDLATLLAYDGVILALAPAADTTVLTNYVNAGGGVYLAGGTGIGGATAEAAAWNPFLNNFGLGLQGGSYNFVVGTLPVTGVHPILSGVSSLYYDRGSTVFLTGGTPNAQIVEQTAGGIGLLGVFDDSSTVIPEPSTWLLVVTGLGAAGFFRRRRS